MKLILILLTYVTSLNLPSSHNCKFDFTHFGDYSCGINLESANKDEKHQDEKTDDDVERLKLKGSNNTHLSQSDLSPACQRFKNLKNIEIYLVKSVDDNLFQQCKNIDRIWIEYFEMDEIPENLFSSQPDLTLIELRQGKLRTFPENLFINQKELEMLRLTHNQIYSLPPNIFKSLGKLNILDLSDNKIQLLHPNLLESLQSLTVLDLGYNKIQDLPKNVFGNLGNLKWLRLNTNQLTTIHSDSFGIHRNLEKTDLADNKIIEIDAKFIDNTAVKELSMRGNICSNEFIFGDINEIKAKLSNCFKNYEVNAENIETTTVGSKQIDQSTEKSIWKRIFG